MLQNIGLQFLGPTIYEKWKKIVHAVCSNDLVELDRAEPIGGYRLIIHRPIGTYRRCQRGGFVVEQLSVGLLRHL